MKSFLLSLLLCSSTTNGFAPARHNHHRSVQVIPSQLNLGSFDEYLQTAEDQDLEYEDTVVGSGDMAMEGKFLTMAYSGKLMANNKQFDEGSISFRLGENRVIPGWERGLVGMKVGGKRTLKIPPKLAYGDRGAGDVIPANAHLEFDVELKGIANGAMEEKAAELTSMSPVKKLAAVFVIGSLLYDIPHYVMHVI
mmetsp:Transcript_10723/g.23753  ORF Transcript_10723/g.23753 Transcript_10723/m.23753 type:complete len:195 (-) Transcript_10723:53-637(-)